MYTAQLLSEPGSLISLTSAAYYQCVSIEGLSPAPAQINTSVVAGMDGARYNSGRVNTRNIVITLALTKSIEMQRRLLEVQLPTKSKVRFYYSSGSYYVYIDGYIDTFECDPFSNPELVQISIICPNPFFNAVSVTEVTLTADACTNIGIAATELWWVGYDVTVTWTAAGTRFIFENCITGDKITVNGTFATGDVIKLCTKPGSKSITLTHNGTTTNLFPSVTADSKFPMIKAGASQLSYSVFADGSDTQHSSATVKVTYQPQFAGV